MSYIPYPIGPLALPVLIYMIVMISIPIIIGRCVGYVVFPWRTDFLSQVLVYVIPILIFPLLLFLKVLLKRSF